jgi:hypothetical protein
MKQVKTKRTSNKKNFLLNNLHWVTWSSVFVVNLFFIPENLPRSLFIFATLLFWAWFTNRSKDPIRSSVLSLLLVLPFNVTMAFPQLADPYVAGVYVNYLVPVVSIIDIFVLLFLASQAKAKTFRSIPLIISLLGGYLLLHSLLHPEMNVVVNSARLFIYSLAAYWGVETIRKGEFWNEVLTVLLFSVLIQGAIGLAQFSMGRSIGLDFLGESKLLAGAIGTSFIKLSNGEFLRAYGTFPHPNVLSGYLLFTFLASASLYFTQNWKKLSLLIMPLSSFLVIFTFSRVAIAMLAISWIVIAYQLLWKKGLGVLVLERFATFFKGEDYALEDRLKLVRESVEIIKSNLWTGVGAGNFTRAMEGSIPYAATGISLLQPVHNLPLLLISEHGIVFGSILSLLFLWASIRSLFVKNQVKFLIILASVSLIAVGMMDHYLLTLPQGLIILTGSLAAINSLRQYP